jgi:signal transduction histidine kinase
VEKLAKTNQALTLLTKLENQEYRATRRIDLSAMLNHTLEAFQELFEMKRLVLEKRIKDNVQVRFHPELAPILLNNLLSNAIRHNQPEGNVSVTLTARALLVENTGKPPQIPTESLFERFKKSNQSDDSIGLGLAIVKQICELNELAVGYHYDNGWHRLEVRFARDAGEAIPTL